MRTILLTAACLVTLLASYSISQDQIKISINKNEQGEMMFRVSGHTTPVALEVNGKAVTIDVDKSEVNMEREFAFGAFSTKTPEDIATAEGTSSANATPPYTQLAVPAVQSNTNPGLATPI